MIYLINKEFEIVTSSSFLTLKKNSIVWINIDEKYIFRAQFSIFGEVRTFAVPINLNKTVYCPFQGKHLSITELIDLSYVSDITIQFKRNESLEKLLHI